MDLKRLIDVGREMEEKLKKLRKITGFNLLFCVAVILWGAFVRATGSGAGCGAHWPLCNGDVVPRSPVMETIIEMTHRLTSGLFLLAIIFALFYTIKITSKGHILRKAAWLSLIFVLVEAAIGAGLVLLELVADNASSARAYWVGGHLVNTFLLVGVMTVNYWLTYNDEKRLRSLIGRSLRGFDGSLFGVSLAFMIVVASSGAIVALGDTLFPSESLLEGMKKDFDKSSHFLIRLRILHPIFAVTASVFLSWFGRNCIVKFRNSNVSSYGKAVSLGVLSQVLLGFLNMILLAPVWMQMVHLLVANALWYVLIVGGLERAKVLPAKTT